MKEQNPETGKVIIQSYKLSTIRQNFGLYGQRTLLRIVEMIQEHISGLSFSDGRDIRKIDTSINTDLWGDKIITMDLRDICPEGITKFEPVREELKSVKQLEFEYEDDKTWVVMSFINKIVVDKGIWKAELHISKDVWQAAMDFSKGFRRIEMEKAMQFQSKYSLRFYELFAGQTTPLTFTVEYLKQMFGLKDRYYTTPMFVKRVIVTAKKELDAISPYTFDFVQNFEDPDGPGRPSVKSITFFPIRQLKHHTGMNDAGKASTSTVLGSELYQLLKNKFGFTDPGIKNNMPLFFYAKQKIDLLSFLNKIAPKALRAKSTPGYAINSVKLELRQKCGVQL